MNLRLIKRLGLPGFAGLIMLLLSGWTVAHWLPVQHAEVADLGSDERRLRHELKASMDADQARQHGAAQGDITSPHQAWELLRSSLPDASVRLKLPSQVLDAARDQGLAIKNVQYRGTQEAWSASGSHVLWRQRMVMPVEGSYPALRRWMAQMLAEPALAIDALDMTRDNPSSDLIKASVSVSLYWREPVEASP